MNVVDMNGKPVTADLRTRAKRRSRIDPDLAMFRRAIEVYDAGQFELAWQIAVAALNGRFPEIVDSGFRAERYVRGAIGR